MSSTFPYTKKELFFFFVFSFFLLHIKICECLSLFQNQVFLKGETAVHLNRSGTPEKAGLDLGIYGSWIQDPVF